MSDKLTPKQQRFAEEYLVDLNATQAAIRAGYSAKTANEQGARLLANVSIRNVVNAMQSERAERTNITQDWVLNSLKYVAEKCMGDNDFSPAGANKALELLGKHLSLFTDKVEHSGKVDGNTAPVLIIAATGPSEKDEAPPKRED